MHPRRQRPKIILLKGNGPIIINEMMELITISLSHGMIGLPLKDLETFLGLTMYAYSVVIGITWPQSPTPILYFITPLVKYLNQAAYWTAGC